MTAEPEISLASIGQSGTDDVDIALGALLLAQAARPGLDLAPYLRHLAALSLTAARALDRESAAECDPREVANALGRTFTSLGYDGDRETYDDLRNADLAEVIDRRRGLPVALGILYIHTARSLGASAHGLNFPGHFLVGLGTARGTTVIDPFNGGRLVDADDIERLAPEGAEITEDRLIATGDRGVLIRLQNNILVRAQKRGDRPLQAQTLQTLVTLAPDNGEYRFGYALSLAETERPGAARAAALEAIALEPTASWRSEAEALAARLARSLN
ncbi:MAG: transglutaminase-like domain-containing protein [Micropepsaceae bacterium]